MAIAVTTDNFIRAETDRYFASFAKDAGGVNRWKHNREAASVEHQLVIRMNRDTLYSFAVVDISEGATVTLPDAGDRCRLTVVLPSVHATGVLREGRKIAIGLSPNEVVGSDCYRHVTAPDGAV